jgi:DNA-directed RNA polymerase specialized sigma24 family protein
VQQESGAALAERSSALLRCSVDAPAGFATFYRGHAEDVLVFLSRRTLDPEVGLDLTAETFAQAFISRGRFRSTSDPEVFAWLYAIARHQLAHYLRKGRAEKRTACPRFVRFWSRSVSVCRMRASCASRRVRPRSRLTASRQRGAPSTSSRPRSKIES